MDIFGSSGKSVVAWGPAASTTVEVSSLEGVVNDSWVLSGVNIGAKEIVDIRQCFNDISYIYALGNDQGKCVFLLTFIVFLGRKNCTGGDDNFQAIKQGIDAYKSNRISQNTEPKTVTIGTFSCQGWLTGIDIGQTDPSTDTCQGVLSFIMQLGS